jgi:hypothetical protein
MKPPALQGDLAAQSPSNRVASAETTKATTSPRSAGGFNGNDKGNGEGNDIPSQPSRACSFAARGTKGDQSIHRYSSSRAVPPCRTNLIRTCLSGPTCESYTTASHGRCTRPSFAAWTRWIRYHPAAQVPRAAELHALLAEITAFVTLFRCDRVLVFATSEIPDPK